MLIRMCVRYVVSHVIAFVVKENKRSDHCSTVPARHCMHPHPRAEMASPALCANMQDRLRQLQTQIRGLEKNKKKRDARSALQGGGCLQSVIVLLVYVMSNESVDLAAQCWCTERRRRGCANEDTSLTRGREVVGAWIAATSEHDWGILRDEHNPRLEQARVRARRFLADADAAVWALATNTKKGHAPTTKQLWHRQRSRETVHSDMVAERSAAASDAVVRSWAWRWRRRWFFKYGKIRTREHHNVSDLQQKARSFWVAAIQTVVSLLGPVFEPRKRAQK